ncbi:hypothetical protein [Streptomyces harbinensis]|uniref:hypothetical protein n=1 Tax=Streptomyces harbinensis TaxID=1176198 RepID=UPI0034DFA93C
MAKALRTTGEGMSPADDSVRTRLNSDWDGGTGYDTPPPSSPPPPPPPPSPAAPEDAALNPGTHQDWDGGVGDTPPPEGRSPLADLSLDPGALAGIAGDARELRFGLSSVTGVATASSSGAAADLRAAGLSSGSALSTATNRFFRKSMDLMADCQTIEEGLDSSVTSHTELEADIAGQLHRVHAALPIGNPVIAALEPGPPATDITGMWGTAANGGRDAHL